ncbi:MAG: radical SAM family heme chaperone HemW [Anaerolineales bacterium]|nr:radical SAM family heme chaperone HemW [Anaerolineales bacterium]
MDVVSVYIHIPFCQSKCAYCDFNSYAGLEYLFEPYVKALAREIELTGKGPSLQAKTVYLGGGTPTVLPVSLLEEVLLVLGQSFPVAKDVEISIEANPGTVDSDYLAGLLNLGVNRLSLGVQSLDDGLLRLLGRIHTAAEAIESYGLARQAGFANINLDLIYGISHQTLEQWQSTLREALNLQPDHLSLYALTLEEHTPLARQVACGEIPSPDDDLAADMYILAEEMLAEEGYVHYEISNWAGPISNIQSPISNHTCRHNLNYWRNQPYLGFGAGAHSYFGGRRWRNFLSPMKYTVQLNVGMGSCAHSEDIDRATEMAETMILGLRLIEEGVSFEGFARRFGERLESLYESDLGELEELGLVEVTAERVRLTPRGRLLGNEVFERFLP